jgi:hypothetical protein
LTHDYLRLPAGLEADGIASSHPLSIGRPVQKLSEIDNWFDDIEYSKGGAVLRMLRAWLNRANAPMLGLDFSASSSSSGTGSSGSTLQQHARRLQQVLSEYLPDSPLAGTSSSSSSNGSSWWLQHQKEHAAAATRQPLLPTLLPAASSTTLESGSAAGASAAQAADPVDHTGSDSSSSSSGGSDKAAWWTQRAHIGGANAELVKGAAAAVGQDSQVKVLPAGDGALATAGYEGIAGLDALGAKDPFIKGLRTYLKVRGFGSMVCFCCSEMWEIHLSLFTCHDTTNT